MAATTFEFPTPYPKQAHTLKCNAHQLVYGGARGGAKSFCAMFKIVQHEQLYGQNGKVLVLRRYYKDLQDFILLCRRYLSKLGWAYRSGEKDFTAPSGFLVRFRILENEQDAEKYQGHEYTLIIVEEAGQYPKPEPIDLLNGAMRSAEGVPAQIFMTANPGGVGNDWLRERFVEPAPDGFTMIPVEGTKIRRYYVPARIQDNPKLLDNDPEYVDRLKLSGPPHLVRAWLSGDWFAAPSGDVFRLEWFSKYYDPEYMPKFRAIIQSWDTAFKKGIKNDRSACTTWGVTKNEIYLIHAWAGRVEFPALKKQVELLYNKFMPSMVLIEDKASGQSLHQEMKANTIIPIKPVKVDGDKLARAYSITPLFETGIIFLPNSGDAEWLYDFSSELCSFPKAKFDDYVDSTSQALDYIRRLQKNMARLERKVVPFTGSVWGV